jgi:hypothetical protein
MIRPDALPEVALLRRYADRGAFADCYVTGVPTDVSLADYSTAFYTTALFRVERWILGWAVGRPSTDAEARQLAEGTRYTFAAWRVEDRAPDQLLLRDFTGRTKSWLMVVPVEGGRTRLYFGSAVVPRVDKRSGEQSMGAGFSLLIRFHRLYSRLLLAAARRRVMKVRK